MIIKGASRADGGQLAAYLMKKGDNGRVDLLEMRNLGGHDLRSGLRLAEVEAEQSNGTKPLYHAQIAPAKGETMTREQQLMAVAVLEKHLGFQDLPRAIVLHEKDGREHLHVAWSRFDQETGTLRRDSFTRMKHVAASMEIALRLGFDMLRNPFDSMRQDREDLSREERRQQSNQGDTHAEKQQDQRSAERRDERKEWITEIWNSSDSAQAFRGVLEDTGYTLAYGKRGFVVVDERGEIHSLARQIEGATAKDVRDRLAALDASTIPNAEEIKAQIQQAIADRNREFMRGVAEQTSHIEDEKPEPVQAETQAKFAEPREAQQEPDSQPVTNSYTAADVLAELTRNHSTFSRNDAARLIDKHTGGGGAEPWMMKEGGLSGLDDDALASAERSYAKWADDNPELAGKFGFARYVSYVQDRQAERDAADPQALQARKDSKAAFDKLMAEVMASPDLIAMGPNSHGRERFTSRDMFETEMEMKKAIDALAARQGHGVPTPLRDAVPGLDQLGEGQRAAFDHVTGEGDLTMIVGYAGTGKSHMLGLAREAWEAAGYRVRGAALSGIAAESLQEGSGIQSRTLAGLLHQLDTIEKREAAIADIDRKLDELRAADGPMASHTRGNQRERAYLSATRTNMAADLEATRLTDRDIIVIDEAAMVGSRDMGRILSAAAEAGAKVVAVGDQEQLQAVNAGAAFRWMYGEYGGAEITEVRRQNAEWMREATKSFGRTETAEALGSYRNAGSFHQASTRDQAKADLIDAWTQARADDPDQKQIILAYLRADVAELNSLAREVYRAEGKLGDDVKLQTEAGEQAFATGDRMYFTKNDVRLQVKNGTLGTIEGIAENRVTVALDSGRSVEFDVSEYGSITHGYAATVHKTQGVTADRAFVMASKYMDRHAAYVAMTRHREQADLYYGQDEFKSDDTLIKRMSRSGLKDTTLDYLARAEQGQASGSLREAAGAFYDQHYPDIPRPAWTQAPEPIIAAVREPARQAAPAASAAVDPLEAKMAWAANLRSLADAAEAAARQDFMKPPEPEPAREKVPERTSERNTRPDSAPVREATPEPLHKHTTRAAPEDAQEAMPNREERPAERLMSRAERMAAARQGQHTEQKDKKNVRTADDDAKINAMRDRMSAERRAAFDEQMKRRELEEKLRRELNLNRDMGGPSL